MRNIVDSEDTEDKSILGSDNLTPENPAELFSDCGPRPEDVQLEAVHVFQLWKIFLDRVNPLMKIIHAPSLQAYIMEAAADITKLALNYQALLYGIYTLAVLSLSDGECQQMLGMTRESALARFSSSSKSCLVRYNFLKNQDMTSLQALLMYMVR